MTNNEQTTAGTQKRAITLGLVALLIVFLLVLFQVGFGRGERPIKPFVPTVTAFAPQGMVEPVTLDFFELGDDPEKYLNQRIRVSGRFSKVALPECEQFSGPMIRWGLINDTLQMNAVGYEEIVRTLPDNIEMTVEGIWTFYPGSVGCGKEPKNQSGLWYLRVEHILQPNPIVASNSARSAQLSVVVSDNQILGEGISPIESPAGEDTAVDTATPSSTPTATLHATSTTTPTTVAVTAQATTPSEGSVTPTSTATVTATAVSGDNSATPTSTPTDVPTISPPATATPGSGPPPAATATPGSGGYPPPPPPPGGGGYP